MDYTTAKAALQGSTRTMAAELGVAWAVLFFVSPWRDPVTGQSIAVDAGLTMA